MSDTLIGQKLGNRYLVLRHVAEEMLGRVCLAKDEETGALVQIKVLHPYLTQQPDKVRRVAREVSATSAVRHPNTLAVLDHGEDDANHWLVLEYMPAESVTDRIESSGPMSFEDVAHAMSQIAEALSAAHNEGVVHRNLNPGNILLLKNARSGVYVKVRDFGLSQLDTGDDEDDDFKEQITTVGTRLGNSFYMAPEYIRDQQVEARSDVYALGCVAYFMLTGHPPFQGRPGQVLDMHLSHIPQPPSRERSELPPWLDELVLHLLNKDPNQRPTAAAVSQTLKRNVSQDLSAPPLLRIDAEGNAIPPTPVEKAVESKWMLMGIAGGFVAILIVGMLAMLAFWATTK
jgi:serine/threonine-protein kinase